LTTSSPTLPISPELLEARALRERFLEVRRRTEDLAAPLSPEDAQVQSMGDVSPTKWHLAHTSWFFETFLLRAYDSGYSPFDPDFHYLFNSYYEGEGPRQPRPERGLISRPGLERVGAYRSWVTERLAGRLDALAAREDWPAIAGLIELGCHHEEQHQELILTDIKHVLAQNALGPAYAEPYPKPVASAPEMAWQAFAEGLVEIGHPGGSFAFDNETPRHKRYVYPFALASRPVTNGEFLAFIEDGGYERAELWLAEGWDWIRANARAAPLYWEKAEDGWHVFTLYGRQPINLSEPVCHLTLYEADAFAAWAGARLPREEELELALATEGSSARVNDLGTGRLQPAVAQADDQPNESSHRLLQLFGDVWEWTASAYAAYPGYRPAEGTVGEYNGKFMCNQYVLRGGSCLTPPGHIRATYRNFFPASAQWQMTGLRLAKDL